MKEIMLRVESVQRDEAGEPETVALTTPGKFGMRGAVPFLSYEETELTGMAGTRTTLFLHKDFIALVRTGRFLQRQEFRAGEETHSEFRTPLGLLDVTVRTERIENTISGGAWQLRVLYDVEVKNLFCHKNELDIEVWEETGAHGSQG